MDQEPCHVLHGSAGIHINTSTRQKYVVAPSSQRSVVARHRRESHQCSWRQHHPLWQDLLLVWRKPSLQRWQHRSGHFGLFFPRLDDLEERRSGIGHQHRSGARHPAWLHHGTSQGDLQQEDPQVRDAFPFGTQRAGLRSRPCGICRQRLAHRPLPLHPQSAHPCQPMAFRHG